MTTLTEFEDFTTPDLRKRIVESVFGGWDSLSKEARKSLRKAVGTPNGFRRGKDLPLAMLRAEAHSLAKQFPDFFSMAIMPVWAEANTELMKLTANHIQGRPPPNSSDEKGLDGYCIEQAEALAGENSQYDREDILLMVRYCAADTDAELFGEAGTDKEISPYASVTGIGILQFLMWLETLPGGSADWDDLVPRLAQDLVSLIARKEEERASIAKFTSILAEIESAHADKLAFFEADTSDWSASKVPWVKDRDALRRDADSLAQTFEEYAKVTPRGSNKTEEAKRREERESLEKAIETRISRINEMLQEVEPTDDSVLSMTLHDFIAGLEAVANASMEGESSQRGGDEPEDDNADDYAREKNTLEEKLAKLENENREMENEVRRLGRKVTLWRSLYEAERRSKDDSEPDPIPAEFADVAHVLEVAEKRFADRLLFKFNSASDTGHPYDYPADVWSALEWLATTYYDSRAGINSVPNLDDSLREVSRFHYTPFQSDNTIGMYPDSYYTQINGHKTPLKEHMGAGIDRNPSNTIRIAFNWDKRAGKVIVGYIGLHQHNRKT